MRAFACASLLVVTVAAASAQVSNFNAFGFLWEKRHGNYNGLIQNSSGVELLNGGTRLKIGLFGTQGAGVKLMQNLGYGVYEVWVTGRFDAINPNTYVGVWLFDDTFGRPENFELDYEFSQWGNQNEIMRTNLFVGNKVAGQPHEHAAKFLVRSFEKHRIFLSYEPHVVRVKCQGWFQLEQRWLDYGYMEKYRTSRPNATLRIGVNLLGGNFLLGTEPGVNNFLYVDNVLFRPAGA